MSIRTRSIQYYENQILKSLNSPTCITQEIRTIEEQHNYDVALQNLICNKEIVLQRNSDGINTYKIPA